MAKAKVLEHLLPYTEDWRVIGRLPPDPVLRLAALAADPEDMKSRWRLSNEEGRRLTQAAMLAPPTPALRPREQRAVLYRMGAEAWRDTVRLAHARSKAPLDDPAWRRLLRLPDRWPIPRLPVTGHDVMAKGKLSGPAVGETLRRLEDWWLASDFKLSRDELLKRISQGG
jgi:poly(A) polymerase